MKKYWVMFFYVFLSATVVSYSFPVRNADPYLGYVVIDASSGTVLEEENPEVESYPASMVKLMDLLLVTEAVERGEHKLDEMVKITAEAAKIGGSQVYLKEGEIFTLDDMLASLIIKSANDSAVAIAIHMAGSVNAFVKMMNDRAKSLGMTKTVFASVHGLPPDISKKQNPDVSTPLDMAKLSAEIVRHPLALQYTSTSFRKFRNDTFELRSHNYLLGRVNGCDGLKTGFFNAGGFSIAATALRDGKRVIAVVMGSKFRKTRDEKAASLIETGFVKLAEWERAEKERIEKEKKEKIEQELKMKAEAEEKARNRRKQIIKWGTIIGIVFVVCGFIGKNIFSRRYSSNGFDF